MSSIPRKLTAAAFATALVFTAAACGTDEDGDGAVTDEEVGTIDSTMQDTGDELGEELDEGEAEVDDSGTSSTVDDMSGSAPAAP